MADKRTGPRRVRGRARLRHDHRHRRLGLAAQADGRRAGHPAVRPHRPHRRLLRRTRRRPAVRGRQGGQGRLRVRDPRLDPDRPPLQGGPAVGCRSRPWRSTRACSTSACWPPRNGYRSSPPASGLGSDVLTVNPSLRTVRSPYDDGEELVAMPALRLDAAVVHVNRADAAGSGQILGPDPFFDELFLGAADRRFVTTERIGATDAAVRRRPDPDAVHQPPPDRRRDRDPGRRPLHRVRPRLRTRRGVPEGVRGCRRRPRRPGPRSANASSPSTRPATRPPPARPPTNGPRRRPPRRAHDRHHRHRGHPGPSTARSPAPRCSAATAR